MNCFVVVLGMSPTGLYVIRELGRAGISTYTVDTERLAAGYSRYLEKPGGWILAADEEQLKNELLELSKRENRPGVLIPTSDKYIEFVVRHEGDLSGSYRFQQSYRDGSYERIVDKSSFARLCAEHQVPHPLTLTLHSSELGQGEDKLRFPFILKPTFIHLVRDHMSGQKVLIVRNREELKHHVSRLGKIDTQWMLQEIIPGPESRITLFGGYFDRQGQLAESFTCRKLRQFPAGFGSASLVRSEALVDTLELSRDFLTKVGFQGVAGTEFKFDERDQQLKIIEINPRPTLWFGCSSAAGKQIALNTVRDLLGMDILPEKKQEQGIEWRYWSKDLATKIFYGLKGRDFLLPAEKLKDYGSRTRRCWAVFSRDDPMPVLGEWLNYGRKFMRRYSGNDNG